MAGILMGDGHISIPKAEYDSLKDDALMLSCLEGAGVDNWDGIDYARDAYWEAKAKPKIKEPV